MPEGGFYQARRISPTGLTIVVVAHAAAITALAMSRMDVEVMKVFKPIQIENIKVPPEPDPLPPPQKAEPKPSPKSEITYVPPVIPAVPSNNVDLAAKPSLDISAFDAGPIGKAEPDSVPRADPVPIPTSEPVRVEARLRSTDLQPPYPAAEERRGREGSVKVRVTIGADGRVKRVEQVSATSDAFFDATERHARRAWRFAPATVDGKAVESIKTLTVHFQLDD